MTDRSSSATLFLVVVVPVAAAAVGLAAPAAWRSPGLGAGVAVLAALGPIVELARRRRAEVARELERDRATRAQMRDAGDGPAPAADRDAAAATRALLAAAADAATAAEAALERSEAITTALDAIAATAEAAERAAGGAGEALGAENGAVEPHLTALVEAAGRAAGSVDELTRSMSDVAAKVGALSTSTDETSSWMQQIDMSIHQVQRNANDTAKLTEEVTEVAGHGFDALEQTIRGINRIKDSSHEATRVMAELDAKVGEIGTILQVIDDVAEQTNLLALNAAIIAAQAGEHGKGFAVVADEIKDLAERATASTKEIADLVKSIATQSDRATEAVGRGSVAVDEGVRLFTDAEDALRRIVTMADSSRARVSDIARTTVEQARSSNDVTDAIAHIADTVEEIAANAARYASDTDDAQARAEGLRSLSRDALAAVRAHDSEVGRARAAMAELAAALEGIGAARTRGRRAADELRADLASVRASLRNLAADPRAGNGGRPAGETAHE